jgi:hypothetical protein
VSEFTPKSVTYDNTRLSDFKDCPRLYFLRHYLGWTVDYGRTAPALIFGGAWHEGMDVIWQHASNPKLQGNKGLLVDLAADQFMKYWTEAGYPSDVGVIETENLGPRTPMIAKEMYWHYVQQRWAFLQEMELVAVEQPFAVPLPNLNDHWYVGRLDKVFHFRGQRLVGEHKTTTAYATQGNFRPDFVDSWNTSSQAKGYEFGAGLFFNGVDGVWIDAALVHKKIHDAFKFIPVAHHPELLMEWLHTTEQWAWSVTLATKQFEAGESVTSCFPKNENHCFGKYGTCPFLDICRTTPDVTKLDGPPVGYKVEKWEPFSILKLDKLIQQENSDGS